MQRIILPESEVCRLLSDSMNRERLPGHQVVIESITMVNRRTAAAEFDITLKKAGDATEKRAD